MFRLCRESQTLQICAEAGLYLFTDASGTAIKGARLRRIQKLIEDTGFPNSKETKSGTKRKLKRCRNEGSECW